MRYDINELLTAPPGCGLVQLKGKDFRIVAIVGAGIKFDGLGFDIVDRLRLDLITKTKRSLISIDSKCRLKDVVAALRNLADAIERRA